MNAELLDRIRQVLELSSRVLEGAKADDNDAWEHITGIVNERQLAIEAVFESPSTEDKKRLVTEMAEAVRQSDAEVVRLIEQKKAHILREVAELGQASHAGRAYLANVELSQDI